MTLSVMKLRYPLVTIVLGILFILVAYQIKPASAQAELPVKLFIDKTSYSYGDTCRIHGWVNPVSPLDTVSIWVRKYGEYGEQKVAEVTPRSNDGKYSYDLQLTSKDNGTFIVSVMYRGYQSETTFNYTTPSQSTVPQSSSSVSQTPLQSNIIPQWVRNNANWWANGQISDSDFIKGLQYLIDNNILRISNQDELNKLKEEIQNLQTQLQQDQEQIQQLQSQSSQSQQYSNTLQAQLNEAQAKINTKQSHPTTVISNGTVNWYFSDSKGNRYHWYIPIHAYDVDVMANVFASAFGVVPTYQLQLPNGGTVSTYDYTGLAKTLSERREFSTVVDTLYDNAGSDDKFIYEVWHMVAELTTYSKDITNTNLLPYEVLTRGEGDCKDKAILIADLLRSLSHTSNWDIHLIIMDINNPTQPQTVNHMIVSVNTGQHQYLIEPTTTPDVNGLSVWTGSVYGWNVPF